MILTIILTIVLTIIIQLLIFGSYIIVTKNNKLTKIIQQQQERLDAISYILSEANTKINELDDKGTFRADDELGYFWNQLKEIFIVLKETT